MNCSTCRRVISTQQFNHIDELSPQVLEHLKNCPQCQAELALKDGIRLSFAEIEQVNPPVNLHLNIMSRIEEDGLSPVQKTSESKGFLPWVKEFFSGKPAQALVLVAVLSLAFGGVLKTYKKQASLVSLQEANYEAPEAGSVKNYQINEAFGLEAFSFDREIPLVEFPYQDILKERKLSPSVILTVRLETEEEILEHQKAPSEFSLFSRDKEKKSKFLIVTEEEFDLELVITELMGQNKEDDQQPRIKIYSDEKIESFQDLFNGEEVLWILIIE